MRYVPPKRRFIQDPHRAVSQKTAFFNKKVCPNIAQDRPMSSHKPILQLVRNAYSWPDPAVKRSQHETLESEVWSMRQHRVMSILSSQKPPNDSLHKNVDASNTGLWQISCCQLIILRLKAERGLRLNYTRPSGLERALLVCDLQNRDSEPVRPHLSKYWVRFSSGKFSTFNYPNTLYEHLEERKRVAFVSSGDASFLNGTMKTCCIII
jgi:hypothetical protein